MSRAIRPIALGVIRRGSEILVFDAFDSVKRERFHRLLGGGIEFGERAEDAVVREMREETGSEARASRLLGVLESFFTFEGNPATRSRTCSRSSSRMHRCTNATRSR